MSVEVIIPALRQASVERLVASLALGTRQPDIVSIISNEVAPFPNPGLPRLRITRFTSERYLIGELDVALRQNVGIWDSRMEFTLIQGDDQVAPPTMIEDSLSAIEGKDYIWGNHRLTSFEGKTLDEIRLAPMGSGRSRESPTPPFWHGYQSCYGGMLVARTSLLREVGGMDMAFLGRHGSEDQQLGYRLMRRAKHDHVYIVEPPFSWHPIELANGDTRYRSPWLTPVRNGCEQHDLEPELIENHRFLRCRACPALLYDDDMGKLFRREPLIRYRPAWVRTTPVWL